MRCDPRAFLVALAAGAALAACSGSFGSSVPPGAAPSGPFVAPSPSATPNNATGIVTLGTSAAAQNLPAIAGFSGSIVMVLPSPKGSASPEAIAVGVTTSTVKPEDAPDVNLESGRGKRAKRRQLPARALFYVTLLPTHDVTLEAYPKLAFDIPREIATQYRDGEFGLAIYNQGTKDRTFRLAAAERDIASPAPTPTPVGPAASLAQAPTSAPTVRPSGPVTPPPPTASPTLPPQRIAFAGTAAPLKLIANRPLVFALYALPKPGSSPSPSAAASGAAASSSPAAGASGAGAAGAAGAGSASAAGAAAKAAAASSAAPAASASAEGTATSAASGAPSAAPTR